MEQFLKMLAKCRQDGRCMRCNAQIYGSTEVFVDTPYYGNCSEYALFIKQLPLKKWVRVFLCQNHLMEQVRMAQEVMEDDRTWHPDKPNPPQLIADTRKVNNGSRTESFSNN